MDRFARLVGGLSPKQAATVAFTGTFLTVIGALILIYVFRHINRKA